MPAGRNGNGNGAKISVAIDIRSLLFLVGCIGPLVAIISLILQVRQDLRNNTMRLIDIDQREKAHYEEVHAVTEEFKRTKLLYCTGLRRDSTRAPDADC